MLWDFTIQCDTKIESRWPDIVVIDQTKKEVKIVDVNIPGNERVNKSEVGKTEKYKMLKDETARMWGMKEVIVIPVVAGALGAISPGFEKYITDWDQSKTCTKISFIGDSKDFGNGTWMLKKRKKHMYHCASLSETFDAEEKKFFSYFFHNIVVLFYTFFYLDFIHYV